MHSIYLFIHSSHSYILFSLSTFFYSLLSLHSRVFATFRLASSISRSTTRTDRSVHNVSLIPIECVHCKSKALPRAKQNLSPKYFIPFEAIDHSIKVYCNSHFYLQSSFQLQEVSLKVSKRDENPIE